MDKLKRDTPLIILDKFCAICTMTPVLWSLSFAVMMALTLSACGGGGGGGGDKPVAVTKPPLVRSQDREPLSFGPSYDSEYNRQSGLDDIGVASAYDKGYAGFNVRAAVVDTGVDGDHSQLSHIERGYDFHGSSHGLEDPDGHGTHVASLMAARRDGIGMHGVAPYAEVSSYRIFDHNGSFGGKTAGQIVPSLVSTALSNDVVLLNNSWASNYEVTDFSKSATKSVLGAELPAWEKAVDAGMVMVWAAGNQGDEQVSVRAGLPYHFSGVEKGWLAVVSFDPTGKEPRYTNRCGVARDWCLAAPGGGDIVSHLGLYGARSGGAYERRSGTSMAAPHVSGALAIVLDAFPQLSAQQGATRLLQTATYEGLTTADGCTITSCSAAQMAEVFGQGKISITDALAPIGTLSLKTRAAPVSLDQTILDSGFLIDEALFSAMTGVRFLAYDSFDKAAFSVPATSLLTRPKNSFSDHSQMADIWRQPVGYGKTHHFYVSNAGTFPFAQMGRGRLHDISQRAMQSWTGLAGRDEQGQWQTHFGYDEHRQAVIYRRTILAHGMVAERSKARLESTSDSWVSLGFDTTKGRFLDSQGHGGLAWGRGQTIWASLGRYQPLSMGGVSAEYQTGTSQAAGAKNCLICAVDASFESWELAYHLSAQPDQRAIGLAFALHQPLHITRADFTLGGAHQHLAEGGALSVHPKRPQREAIMRLTSPVFGGRMQLAHHIKPSQTQTLLGAPFAHQLTASWQLSF